MKYEIKAATVQEAIEIDTLLSREDACEAVALGHTADELTVRALKTTVASGGEAFTLRVNGKVCGMFGIALSPPVASPWLLGVDHIWADQRWKRLLLNKQARAIVSDWIAAYGFLLNFISADNYTNIRYLKRMGFTVNETTNPDILVFHQGTSHV